MTHRIDLEMNAVEGALVRVLGLTERRGYRAVAVTADESGSSLLLSLTVRSERPIELLLRQLAKLFDVQTVALAQTRLEVAR